MPYVRGSSEHGVIHIADVYHSPNVFANRVSVALWQAPGSTESSPALVFAIPATGVLARPNTPPAADKLTYDPPPVTPEKAEQNVQAGAKPNTPDDFTEEQTVQDQPETKCEATGNSVLGFLQKCISEASTGVWRESGQKGNPSNPNILNIWKSIGLTGGPFNTDQTPWCAGFACLAMKESGLKWVREAGARNLANKLASGSVDPNYKSVSVGEMQPGDLVLWSSGHVNFCYTANGGKYTFVGGNQSPAKNANPPVRDPQNDGDVTISWPGGWTSSKGGIVKVVRLDC